MWEFHKFHHSATVLNPLTTTRFHPLEWMLIISARGLLVGIWTAAFAFIFRGISPSVLFYGLPVLALGFNLFDNLRHSHIWISFGKLDHYFISPAMHQLHHSCERKHWDINFGRNLSIWDKLFKTLYVSKDKEEFRIGVTDDPEDKWNEMPLWKWYITPFVAIYNKKVRSGLSLRPYMVKFLTMFKI